MSRPPYRAAGSGFDGLQTVAVGGAPQKGVQGVAFLGQNAMAYMPLAGKVWKHIPLAGYDTPIKNGYLNDIDPGDLIGDGRKDLVLLETAKHYLDILSFNSRHRLVLLIRWRLFEDHTFRSLSDESPEPREALVANVTGHKDKRKDLIVVVHERILVYRQD